MVRIAKKDTYATEDVGGGVEVRRRVFAGQRVPESFDIDAGDVEETAENPSGLRFHDAVENPTVLEEGDSEPSDETPEPVTITEPDFVEAKAEEEDEEKPAPVSHRGRKAKADE